MEFKRTELNPFEIAFDKENPRDENQKQIENEPSFKKLKEHIKQFGLFYPIGVKKEKVNGKEYVLVDGERRLRACQLNNLEKIPVILVEGDVDKRILAYQLHMLGKPWSPRVLIKSMNQIIKELKKDKKTEEEIMNIIEKQTNISKQKLKDIFKVFKYGDKVVKLIECKESYRTFLIQSEDVFLPLIKIEFPNVLKEYGEDKIRKIIGDKLIDERLGKTTWSFRYLRDYLKDECTNKKYAEKVIKYFFEDKDMDISQIRECVEEYNKKEMNRIIVETKKDIQKISDEIPKTKNIKDSFLPKEKRLIEDDIFYLIFYNLKGAIKEYERRAGIKIEKEKELQDFVYALLRCIFISADFENPTNKLCGTSNKIDFVIKDHKIAIETKLVRKSGDEKRIFNELSEDYNKYLQTEYKNIINYVYDPDNHLAQNHSQFQQELDQAFKTARNYVG